MMKPRNLGALLALGALTALPACSMFGGGSSNSGSSQYRQSNAVAPASYGVASASTGTSGTVAPVSPDMIRKVQTTLQQNNDYKGRVDGVWGPQTENGVRTWQQAHNLNTSGEIDMATLQSMNISADNEANNQPAQANANTAAQPTGDQTTANQNYSNQNYSTGPNRTAGSTYSSNNGPMPANSASPANQGASAAPSNDNSGASSAAAPTSTGGNANH
jgi:peptidoglycan hydrolase-like protein with peptidoglycan-binding domain